VLVGDQAKVAIEIEAVLQDPTPENQTN